MAKKTTLNDLAKILGTHGKEIRDLTQSIAHVVKHMATKENLAKLATKEQLVVLHMRVSLDRGATPARQARRGSLPPSTFVALPGA